MDPCPQSARSPKIAPNATAQGTSAPAPERRNTGNPTTPKNVHSRTESAASAPSVTIITGCKNKRAMLRNVTMAGRGDRVMSKRKPPSPMNKVAPAAIPSSNDPVAAASHCIGVNVTVGRPYHAAGCSTTNPAADLTRNITTRPDTAHCRSLCRRNCPAPTTASNVWIPNSKPMRDAALILAAFRFRYRYRFRGPL